jgi:hypothetical protein
MTAGTLVTASASASAGVDSDQHNAGDDRDRDHRNDEPTTKAPRSGCA